LYNPAYNPVYNPNPGRIPAEDRRGRAALLEEQVNAVRADAKARTAEKARAVCYLAGVALRAIEAGNMAARVEALEAVLKQRNGDAK
jgi:hypothetical protein